MKIVAMQGHRLVAASLGGPSLPCHNGPTHHERTLTTGGNQEASWNCFQRRKFTNPMTKAKRGATRDARRKPSEMPDGKLGDNSPPFWGNRKWCTVSGEDEHYLFAVAL